MFVQYFWRKEEVEVEVGGWGRVGRKRGKKKKRSEQKKCQLFFLSLWQRV